MPKTEPFVIDRPVPGYYTGKLNSKGPLVPIELILTPDRNWRARINDVLQDYSYHDSELDGLISASIVLGELYSQEFARILAFRRTITRHRYDKMLADIEWCKKHRPHDPRLHPTKPIDLGSLPSLW